MIEVLRSGSHMCLVDQGRAGYGRYGIPCSGAMDMQSYLCGQSIVGNQVPTIAIEMFQSGHQLLCHTTTHIAITGAEVDIDINGKGQSTNKLISIEPNDIISVGYMPHGCRIYLALRGGIDSPVVYGSVGDISGYFTSILRQGDKIKIKRDSPTPSTTRIRPMAIDLTQPLYCYRGPEYDLLDANQIDWLFGTSFLLSNKSNRMGIRTEGTTCQDPVLPSIVTSPTLCGTVQLPSDGLPIILMRDAQTTGGYPRLLIMGESSINQLAQRKPGQRLQFILKE